MRFGSDLTGFLGGADARGHHGLVDEINFFNRDTGFFSQFFADPGFIGGIDIVTGIDEGGIDPDGLIKFARKNIVNSKVGAIDCVHAFGQQPFCFGLGSSSKGSCVGGIKFDIDGFEGAEINALGFGENTLGAGLQGSLNIRRGTDQHRGGLKQGFRVFKQRIKFAGTDIICSQAGGVDRIHPVLDEGRGLAVSSKKGIDCFVKGGDNIRGDAVFLKPGFTGRADQGCGELLAAHPEVAGDRFNRIAVSIDDGMGKSGAPSSTISASKSTARCGGFLFDQPEETGFAGGGEPCYRSPGTIIGKCIKVAFLVACAGDSPVVLDDRPIIPDGEGRHRCRKNKRNQNKEKTGASHSPKCKKR